MTATPANSPVVESLRKHKTDTGSPAVQIALLTDRINHLAKHLETKAKDHATRLGLLKLVGQRRRLLNYLNNQDEKQYKNILTQLNLRK